MAETDSRFAYQDARRRRLDRITQHIVVGSGLLVMMALVLIFFYLLYVVAPLFVSPSVTQYAASPQVASVPSAAVGISDDGSLGYRIDQQGFGEFMVFAGGQSLPRTALSVTPITRAVAFGEGRPHYALLSATGHITIVAPFIPLAGNAQPAWRYPFGKMPLALTADGTPLRHLALALRETTPPMADNAAATMVDAVAIWVTQDNRLTMGRISADGVQLVASVALSDTPVDYLVLTPRGDVIYSLNSNQLTSWRVSGETLTLSGTATLPTAGPWRLALLSGGYSLLVYTEGGKIFQWFDVPGTDGLRLTEIRDFPQRETQGIQLVPEASRRVFATLTPQGELSLFASKQSAAVLTQQVAAQAQRMVFSAHGKALLLETPTQWYAYRVDNPYPDIGWRGLWQRVWYENYPQPDFIWQSTAADDSYQAKFSLVPLLAGSLKATLYDMLFATPLALAAAVYTACFMTPGLRRWVKPTLEVMGALPTVVVGLIAALWLAPHVETYLSAILALPLLCTLGVLGVGALTARWPRVARWMQGREVLLLMPVLLLIVLGVCWFATALEVSLFRQPLFQWMDGNFVQRNALVAGIALGFALIPLIFSLAEDALFNVPMRLSQGSLALGATPWQTLWHVVLPSASAGIFAALMLSFGRAVGETMIVLMATGNTPIVDAGLLQGLRSLAANIAIEMPEAVMGSGHYRVLFLTALVLFIFTFVVNTLAETLRQRLRRRYRDEGDHS
ncbi:ABC transporter permease subunit [Symbiopectobacterium sp.]|uniref:ABC transporter permease subunit n=1 Tax=Symbiopectobacterium sp. TaxID=2952789 RepID=UPI003F3E80DE